MRQLFPFTTLNCFNENEGLNKAAAAEKTSNIYIK